MVLVVRGSASGAVLLVGEEFGHGGIRDDLPLLEEQSPTAGARPGPTPARSRVMTAYTTRRDSISPHENARALAPEPVQFNSAAPSCDCLAHVYGNAADHPNRECRYPSDMSDAEVVVDVAKLPEGGSCSC